MEKNANLSERFFANKALLPALEMDRDFNKHEVETATQSKTSGSLKNRKSKRLPIIEVLN